MKRIYCLFVSILILLLSIFSLRAQSTEGTEFWLTFGRNGQISQAQLQIRIVGGSKHTSGTIYFTNEDTTINFDILPYGIYDHFLDFNQSQVAYNTVMGKTNRSIHILTSESVNVYAHNHYPMTSDDVTNVLPVTALGNEYYAISYTQNVSNTMDAYAVVATMDGTQLYHNGDLEETLNAGEVYYRTSNTDMTGSRITSNYPVAFFAVNQRTRIPPLITPNSVLMQQLPPVNTWGRNFFVPVSVFDKEIVRIVASQNGTDITLTGGTIRTDIPDAQTNLNGLQSGQFVELDISLSENGCYIITNKPVGVCSYIRGFESPPILGLNPAQCWVPSLEQKTTHSLIAPFIPMSISNLTTYYALVVTPTPTKTNTMVSIGGAAPEPLIGDIWYDNTTIDMSFCSVPLTNNNVSYLFSNQKGLIIYGYAHGTLSAASYYYLAGSAMRDLDAAFYANDIHFQDLKDNSMCAGEVEFRAEIEGLHPTHPERLTWWIDSVEYVPAKNLEQWSKPFSAGEYEIEMKVRYENEDTATKTGTLIVHSCNQSAAFYMNNVYYQIDTTFCDKNVNFHADIEGLHPTDPERIMWYIDNVFETSAASWNKTFENNGTYEIKLVVHYDNDTYATLIGTLKVKVFWVKMRNIKH